jgi:tRNA(fMet)-specific endonuclease VapC
MILLDSDHVSHLKYIKGNRADRLMRKLAAQPLAEVISTTIITVEEQMRGWLASIAKERQVRRQVTPYLELTQLFEYFQVFKIVHFDEAAVDEFEKLKASKIHIGTMDLKIAAITLTHHALLLSANLRDFQQIPGLRVENWLE